MDKAAIIRTWNECHRDARPESYTVAELSPYYRHQRRWQIVDGRVCRRRAKLALFMARGDVFEDDQQKHGLGLPTSAWYRQTFIDGNPMRVAA